MTTQFRPPSRVTRSRAQAAAAYNHLSRFYDLLSSGAEARFLRQGLAALGVREGERVLDIGCGTGQAVVALARAVGAMGQVFGIDLSPDMLRVARARVERTGLGARVQLQCGDALTLPYADASLDAALMSFTLELFDTPEIPLVLAECRRVLKPGGRLGAVAMSQPECPGLIVRLYEWVHERFPAYVDCRPIAVRQSIEAAHFGILVARVGMMYGLPVETVLAEKTGR